MTYALVEGGVVTNLIWLYPENEQDFPGAVAVGDLPVRVGDAWQNGMFLRGGEKLRTPLDEALSAIAELDEALMDAQMIILTGGYEA